MDMPAVEAALAAARAGDPRGFSELFEGLSGAVAGYLRARGVVDAEDVTNDVFLRAFTVLHTFTGDAKRFRSWLFTIAHNAAIDHHRRARRRPVVALLDDAADRATQDDVERDVIGRLAYERVRQLLERCTPDQRDVLTLRLIGECTLDETAAILGKSYEAVKAHQRRGLEVLRRALATEEDGVPR